MSCPPKNCTWARTETSCAPLAASLLASALVQPKASSFFPWKTTGIANVIVTRDLYDRDRLLVMRSKFLLVEGALQNQDGVIHVKATRLFTVAVA
ncbi:MAG TPA: hypothetical protein VK638_23475 [Edaphobacter sp.]|nr:hypothetical protein [Edaphobacter sp.]